MKMRQKVLGKRKKNQPADKKARWNAMIEEATVDCYNEYEEFAGMLALAHAPRLVNDQDNVSGDFGFPRGNLDVLACACIGDVLLAG